MPDASSPDLVVLAQRGEADAIGTLYDTHYQAIFRYFRARVGNRQLAEDLTGDVFRRMLTGLPYYRPLGLPFRAWLFRIAHNLLVDHYRQESGRMSVELQETERHGGGGEDPASVVEHKLTMEQTFQALSELDSSQRDVLALRFLGGLSLREVALALNRTEDSVKALQRRGLAALRLSLIPE
jgi:RNA polymerase sigma-70 factor (ECF subfamily)